MSERVEVECDYCGGEMPKVGYMRAVGFDDLDGARLPLVKTHCGECPTPDDVDPEASRVIRSAWVSDE
jgi:hypothetical protein